jgi:hypothetical protein
MKLIDSNRYYLPNTKKQYLHIATVQHQLREYICFANVQNQKVYIEEITGGSLEFVADDGLATGLHNFLTERGILDINKPLLPDRDWQYMGKK